MTSDLNISQKLFCKLRKYSLNAYPFKQSVTCSKTKTTVCYGLEVTAAATRSLLVSLEGPNAGSECVAVRGADMWASGEVREGQKLQEHRGETRREGRRAALSASWGLNRVPSEPDSPCLLVNQGSLWQQSNERRHWALNIFFFYNIGSIVVLFVCLFF